MYLATVSEHNQAALALPWPCDVALREDALTLLRSLPDGCAAVVFFDPQYRGALDHLKLGNEGARQQGAPLPGRSEIVRSFSAALQTLQKGDTHA